MIGNLSTSHVLLRPLASLLPAYACQGSTECRSSRAQESIVAYKHKPSKYICRQRACLTQPRQCSRACMPSDRRRRPPPRSYRRRRSKSVKQSARSARRQAVAARRLLSLSRVTARLLTPTPPPPPSSSSVGECPAAARGGYQPQAAAAATPAASSLFAILPCITGQSKA